MEIVRKIDRKKIVNMLFYTALAIELFFYASREK